VQTYYRWRKEYGGLKLEQAKRMKELEKENTRLKRLETGGRLSVRLETVPRNFTRCGVRTGQRLALGSNGNLKPRTQNIT
jgi:hypothetical protein